MKKTQYLSGDALFKNVPLLIPANPVWGYQAKIPKGFQFEELIIRFKKSTSKNYKKALYVASFFPDFVPISNSSEFNSIAISSHCILLEYRDAIDELLMLTYGWKKREIILNGIPGDGNTIRDLFWILETSINAYNSPLPEITSFDIKGVLNGYSPYHQTENALYLIVRDLYPDIEILRHIRPDFLEHLELDIYIPSLKIAFEYQGQQHFNPVAHWGGKEALRKTQERDSRKKKLCRENYIELIIFTYEQEITEELVIETLLDIK